MVVCICNPSYLEGLGKRIMETMRLYLKNKTKRAGGMAQIAEHLPIKYGALNSNLVPHKGKEKRGKDGGRKEERERKNIWPGVGWC
jgi:hypothetical protein